MIINLLSLSLFCAITGYHRRMLSTLSWKTEPGKRKNLHFLTAITHKANPVKECVAALSVQARGRSGPGLHTGLLSGRVNTLGSVLNKCHSQWGRSRPSPPARLYADNLSQNPCWSDPAVACGSGVGKAGEERSRIVQAVVSMAVQVTQVFGCVFAKSHMKSLFTLDSFDVGVDNIRTF